MAGDFVMVQHATPRKPEVLRLATLLAIEPSHAFGLCVITWMWFDEQTEDGRALGATELMLDAVVSRNGFSRAFADVGWLTIGDGYLALPNFDRMMGHSAKKRAKNTKRQQKRRHTSVAKVSRLRRDKSATKEEKRREEKRDKERTPLPPLLQTPEFAVAWTEWEQHRRELKKPLKPTMAVAQLKMLAELGCDRAVRMIRHTIAMGWQGLRAPEGSSNGEQPTTRKPPAMPPPVQHHIPKTPIT